MVAESVQTTRLRAVLSVVFASVLVTALLSCSKPTSPKIRPSDVETIDNTNAGAKLEKDPVVPSDSANVSEPFQEERFVSVAMQQLKRLTEFVELSLVDDKAKELSQEVADNNFVSTLLRPDNLATIYESSGFEVLRPATPLATRPQIKSGLPDVLSKLFDGFEISSPPHLSFHIYQVDEIGGGEAIETLVHVEADGRGSNGLIEQDAHWRIGWTKPNSSDPKIRHIVVEDFEEVQFSRAKSWFTDATGDVFRSVEAFDNQFAFSNTHWRKRIERHHIFDKSGHHGISVGDLNQDGLDDVYVCQPGGLPNRVFLQQADGSLRDASRPSGADFLDNSRSALLVDFDNDGTQDLILATASGVLFLQNDGRAHFRFRGSITAIIDAYSMAAADFDQDGDLDIYACRYHQADADPLSLPIPSPYFDAKNGGRNYLIRNDGDWRMSNATKASGLDTENNRFSYAALWIDFDQDGDQDLYVANDFGTNNLFQNNGSTAQPRFTDVAKESGMQHGAFGMSAAAGDIDRDGWEDIYVGNMFSSAGSRISRLPEFKPGISKDGRAKFQHLARGNTLFHNLGGKVFRDVSVDAGVTMGRWSWGSLFVDIDNNGWQDLIVANGYITGDKPTDDL